MDTSSFYTPAQTGAYPIVLVTYEVVCSKYPDSPTGVAVRAFMQATWCGQEAWTSTAISRYRARLDRNWMPR